MRVKIIPHGALRKLWPAGYECEAATAAQALNAVQRQHNLRRYGKQFQIRLVGFNSEQALKSPLTKSELHVVPDFSGGGGVFKVILGVVLVVVGIVIAIYGGPLFGAYASAIAGTVGSLGASLVLSGIAQLLTPTPSVANPNSNADQSRYLGAGQNTTAIGTRIQLCYGRYLVYGQYLSFAIQADLSNTGPQYNSPAMIFADALG